MQLIGVDTGGTFTDAVEVTSEGTVFVSKSRSTPAQVELGVLAAIEQLAEAAGTTIEQLLAHTDVLAHGTTVGLNALLTASGAKVGLVTTAGFESTLHIAKANKVHGLADEDLRRPVRWDKPVQLVPPHRIAGVRERVDRDGHVLEALDEPDARAALRALAEHGIEALAIALLWSPVNPEHERRLGELAAEVVPGLHVSLSSTLAPRLGEYERSSSVVLDAYVAPLVSSYLTRLQTELARRGFRGLLLVTRMGGGVQAVETARRSPIQTLRSGPAGGLAAAQRVGTTLGHRNVVATDVGGTSFDVGLVIAGEPARASRPMIDRYSLALPVIDITSIGTGGGSVAWVEPAMNALRVGPDSAGAEPGPACYGQGGTRPTLTDAAAVLGYIERLGGPLRLDVAAASAAIEREIAIPLGLGLHAAAEGIVHIACEQMKDLVRRTTIERGHDPSDFALYAYGGAGPQYVGRFAAGLGVREVVIPAFAAQFSAFGAIASDIRATTEQDVTPAALADSLDAVNATLERLTDLVRAELDFNRGGLAGAHVAAISVHRSLSLRFYRQVHRIDVPLPEERIEPATVDSLLAQFRQSYEQVVGPGSANTATPIEVVAVSAQATLPMPTLRTVPRSPAPALAHRHRKAWFDGAQLRCPVLSWAHLGVDQHVAGPAFIESDSTTVVVHPGQSAVADEAGHLRLLIPGATS